MTEQRFGKIIVTGTDADIALAAEAFSGQLTLPHVEDLQPKEYHLAFLPKREFLSRGLVIPGTEGRRKKSAANPKGGIAAYGYTLRNQQVVNSDRSRAEQIYVCRHEPFHPIVAANLTKAKREKLVALVIRVAGSAYQNKLREVLCDAFVELFWGQGSILDDYYGDIADSDLKTAWQILTATESNPEPVEDEEPAPLPLPDPQIAELTAALQACQKDRDDALQALTHKNSVLRSIADVATKELAN